MINAKQAREYSDSWNDKQVQIDIESIEPKIKNAMSKGEYSITIPETLNISTQIYLTHNDYEVEVISSQRENYSATLIKW